MRYSSKIIQKAYKLTALLTLLLLPSVKSLSQETTLLDSLKLFKYPGYIIDYTQKGIKYTNEIIDNVGTNNIITTKQIAVSTNNNKQ